MEVKNISNQAGTQYDPFLVDALNIGSKKVKSVETTKTNSSEKIQFSADWQKQILSDALDKLENNIQVDDSSPLFAEEAAPIETYQEALTELKSLFNSDFDKFASAAQANLTPGDILYLFEDQIELTA
jgi:hypothetical protein